MARRASIVVFKPGRQLDIRAEQRTYDGAYSRACIASLSLGLVISKLFEREFLPISILFTIYGLSLFLITIYRTSQMETYFDVNTEKLYYKTSGNIILYLGAMSLVCYLSLFALILKL